MRPALVKTFITTIFIVCWLSPSNRGSLEGGQDVISEGVQPDDAITRRCFEADTTCCICIAGYYGDAFEKCNPIDKLSDIDLNGSFRLRVGNDFITYPLFVRPLSRASDLSSGYTEIVGIPETDATIRNRLYLLRPVFLFLNSLAALPQDNTSASLNLHTITNGFGSSTRAQFYIQSAGYGNLSVSVTTRGTGDIKVVADEKKGFRVPNVGFKGLNTGYEFQYTFSEVSSLIFTPQNMELTDTETTEKLTWEGNVVTEACILSTGVLNKKTVTVRMDPKHSWCSAECWAPARCSFLCVDRPVISTIK